MNKYSFLFVSDKLSGAERVLAMFAKELYVKGYDVEIIIWNIGNTNTKQIQEFLPGFKIIFVKSSPFALLRYFFYTNKDNRVFVSSNIQSNFILCFFKCLFLFSSFKIIIREPSSIFNRNYNIFYVFFIKYLYRFYQVADLVIFQTNEMKDLFFDNVNIKHDHIRYLVLNNPFNYEDVDLNIKKKFDGNVYDLLNQEYYLLSGRLIPEKGFEYAIRAFSLFRSRGIKLFIIGDGPELFRLKNLVNSLDLSDSVLFLGFVRNPFPFYKRAKCCIISSTVEGFPNTLLEMLYLNNNVICTKCSGGLKHIPGITLINTNSVNDLYEAMELYFINPPKFDRDIVIKYLTKRSPSDYVNSIINFYK